jgi:hypothetical protein
MVEIPKRASLPALDSPIPGNVVMEAPKFTDPTALKVCQIRDDAAQDQGQGANNDHNSPNFLLFFI